MGRKVKTKASTRVVSFNDDLRYILIEQVQKAYKIHKVDDIGVLMFSNDTKCLFKKYDNR